MSALVLYSATVCPFAQRTRMLLAERVVDFELVEVDLNAPDSKFLELSPHAKVPLLVHDGHRIWESSIINEYLDEVLPGPRWLDSDPVVKAHTRTWIDYFNTQFVPSFYKLLLAQRPELQTELTGRLLDRLKFMESGLAESGGPWWMGSAPSLADLALYPFMERMCVLNHYRNFHLPASCARLSSWFDRFRGRASARATGHSVAFFIERYAAYADGTTQSDTAAEMLEA